jgi:transcriptional regulator with XRE-family HTH domain
LPDHRIDLKLIESQAKALGAAVARRREEAGCTIYYVEQTSGLDYNTIKRFELGVHIADLRTFLAICLSIGIEPSEVLEEVFHECSEAI